MKKQKKVPRKLSTARVVIGHLIAWPIFHLFFAMFTLGFSLIFTLPLQILDLALSLHCKSKRAEYERQEMLEAIRSGATNHNH